MKAGVEAAVSGRYVDITPPEDLIVAVKEQSFPYVNVFVLDIMHLSHGIYQSS